jgi:hypothetical protein
VSTLGDLHRWHLALKEGRIVSNASQALATTPGMATSLGGKAGYGWFVDDRAGSRSVSHSGGNGVVAAHMERRLDRDLFVVHFSNNANGVYRQLPGAVAKIALGESVPPFPSATYKPGQGELGALAGVYVTPDGDEFVVERRRGQLQIPLSSLSVVGFLSGQPQEAAPAETAPAAAVAAAVIRGVENRDFTSMRNHLPAGVDPVEEQQFWERFWPQVAREHGGLRKVVAIGSRRLPPTPNRPSPSLEVRLLAQLACGPLYMTASKTADGKWSLNPTYQAPLPPAAFRLIPTGPSEFLVRTLPTAKDAYLSFQRSGDRAIQITMSNGTGGLAARRLRDVDRTRCGPESGPSERPL